MNQNDYDKELSDLCAKYYADPLGWVLAFFDWGHGGLVGQGGPDVWQAEELGWWGQEILERGFDGTHSVMPIRAATSSGHGIGKSALVSWQTLFLMSTRPYCKGTVTANTGDQLRTKTWPEISKWRKLCLTGHWFEMNSGKGSLSLYHRDSAENWRVDGITSKEENSEAFAGQHNAGSTSFYIFDEASAIPDKIWEVADGGLTDGEPMFFAYGNPTKATGRFRECFSDKRYKTRRIDSRTTKQANKQYLQELVDTYGEDSDVVRVRVRGMFPKASEGQFFPEDDVREAMRRELPHQLPDEALILGIDYSRGGTDETVLQFRRGLDARSETRYSIPAERTRDSMRVISAISMVIGRHRPDYIFGDAGGLGGPINDRLRQLGHPVVDVGFGNTSDEKDRFANKTAEMSHRLREWLFRGGCLPRSKDLLYQLTAREFGHDSKDRLVMESKKHMKQRLHRSPDDMDALLLTFGMPVMSSLGYDRDDRPGDRSEPWVARGDGARYNPLEKMRSSA